MKIIKVAGCCVNQTPLDWKRNFEHIAEAVNQAVLLSTDLLCVPELAISGYGCEDTFFSDYVIEKSLESLAKLLPICKGIVVTVGLPLVYENAVYNCVALIENTKLLGFVAKQRLAGDGIHYEPRWFKPWPEGKIGQIHFMGQNFSLGDLIFEIDGVRIGFEICEDAWNGVRPAQKHYLENVDIILNPSASHFAFGKTSIRKLLVTEASRSYNCTYVYSNLLGNEAGRIIYDGEILIASNGELLARNKRFSFKDVQILAVTVDISSASKHKKKSFNFQPQVSERIIYGSHQFNRQLMSPYPELPKVYCKEEEFYLAVTLGLFDYLRKSYSRGFVISLSGGADSAACAILASQSISRAESELSETEFKQKISFLNDKANRVICIYQATQNSSPQTLESAQKVAENIGASFYLWDVNKLLENYQGLAESCINRPLDWQTDDLSLQNIQARVRAPGVWMIANLKNNLLLTTSNRSEAAVGYATMDGDTAGGLAPSGGIDKAFLRHWLIWAQTNLNLPALNYVNQLQPTAELRPLQYSQTDEKDLMPYELLDKIEKCVIRDYKSPTEVLLSLLNCGFTVEHLKIYIRKFFTLWAKNQWKRERYAPCFHLDDENLDPRTWCRFPILNSNFYEELQNMDNYQI